MTLHDRRRTDPVVTHAYTVPVVHEVPIHHLGLGAAASTPYGLGRPLVSVDDSNVW
jgi:hypothetical protein